MDRTLIHTGNAVGLVGPGRLRLKAFTLRVLGLIFTALSGPGLPPREFLPLGEEAGVRFPQQWLVIEFIVYVKLLVMRPDFSIDLIIRTVAFRFAFPREWHQAKRK